jgi:hypothetical protein
VRAVCLYKTCGTLFEVSDATAISAWTNYLSVMAESAATLTGLVFVAVSINLTRVLATPGLPGRAGESVSQLLGVVLVATSALIPGQTPFTLGVEILVMASALWVAQTVFQLLYLRSKDAKLRWTISRMMKTQCSIVPFFIAGFLLVRGSPAKGMYWLAPGFALSLVSGVLNAWILLVEILR